MVVPGRQGLEQRRASEESPEQGRILTAPAGFTGDLQRKDLRQKNRKSDGRSDKRCRVTFIFGSLFSTADSSGAASHV